MTTAELGIHFFLQLAVILGVCRIVGLIARRMGQPQVIGEMIAGILLGPSLLGLLAPQVQTFLFPKGPAMSIIYAASQIGLALYMFLVGLEFDTGLLKTRVRSAVAVSITGVATPMVLGAFVAVALVANQGTFFTAGVSSTQAILFMGAAIGITAFPTLARIIYDRKLNGTSLGTLALAAGSVDDAISWCMFAVVLAFFKQSAVVAVMAILGGALYALFVLTAGKRMLSPLGTAAERRGGVTSPMLALVLVLLMTASWVTDTIGIYAVFGAFILGVAMPRGLFAERVKNALEPLVTVFLIPLFFIYSGLNTQIGLVDSLAMWGVTLLLLAISVVAKGVACYIAARLNKEPNREALAIGSLMNARGMMELILLNIGLQAGLITPLLFTMLVFMAIITTLAATPLFEVFYGRHRRRQPVPPEAVADAQEMTLAHEVARR
jgi:Kef-type K+ transport system membrane component KefB